MEYSIPDDPNLPPIILSPTLLSEQMPLLDYGVYEAAEQDEERAECNHEEEPRKSAVFGGNRRDYEHHQNDASVRDEEEIQKYPGNCPVCVIGLAWVCSEMVHSRSPGEYHDRNGDEGE